MKALTDEQIEEVRRRYAAGESKVSLSREFYVSDVTIGKYVRDITRENLYPPAKPTPAAKTQQKPEPAAEPPHDPEPAPEPAAEPQPETTDLYEVARGFEIFVKNHIAGDFFISVSRNDGVTIITASADDEEITIKRKESTS